LEIVKLDSRPTVGDVTLATIIIIPMLANRIKEAQEKDPELKELKEKASQGEAPSFNLASDSILRTGDCRVLAPNDAKLREEISYEARSVAEYMA
jgi:hypothetical protein